MMRRVQFVKGAASFALASITGRYRPEDLYGSAVSGFGGVSMPQTKYATNQVYHKSYLNRIFYILSVGQILKIYAIIATDGQFGLKEKTQRD